MKTPPIELTARGFGLIEFNDGNGEACSLQESSAARDEGLIWLGLDRPDVQVFGPNGWEGVQLPKHTHGPSAGQPAFVSGRMHLTQGMVRELLPYLEKFAETGSLR